MSTPYKVVVKEVAEGLTKEEIDQMMFSLPFTRSKKSSIKNGYQLIEEMEENDLIDEEENRLEELHKLMEGHGKKRLAKSVKKFIDSHAKKDDETKQNKENTETGVLHKTESAFQTTVPSTQAPPQYYPNNAQAPGSYQNNAQAPTEYYQNNQYGIECTSPAPSIYHQGYPTNQYQQQYQPGNYPSNFTPAQHNQPDMMPSNQCFFPQNSAVVGNQNGGYPSNIGYHSNQMQPPSMMTQGMTPQNQYQHSQPFQQFAPGQTQQDFRQQACPPMPQQYPPRQPVVGQSLAAQNTYLQNQNNNAQRLPNNSKQELKSRSNELPPNIPSSRQLQGQRSESFSDNEVQDVVCDTPIQSLEGLTLNDSIGSLKSVEPVAKAQVSGRKGSPADIVVADGRRVNNVPASSVNPQAQPAQFNAPAHQALDQMSSAQIPTQPALAVNAHHTPANQLNAPTHVPQSSAQHMIPAQPASAGNAQPASMGQFNVTTQPLSSVQQRLTTQPVSAVYGVRLRDTSANNTPWRRDGRKVTSFQKDGYELRIVSNSTQPEHYETSNGLYVMLSWGSEYGVELSNNNPHRCAAEAHYDGNKYVGEFELKSHQRMIIKGPTMFDAGKFCFVKPELAGMSEDTPDNGVIKAVFMPQKIISSEAWNDLSRGIGGHQGQMAADPSDEFFEGDWPEPVVADALPFNLPTYGTQAQGDVQRSVMGGRGPPGPPSGLRTGATVLVGHNNQEFQKADAFDVDKTKKVEITLRLVGWE